MAERISEIMLKSKESQEKNLQKSFTNTSKTEIIRADDHCQVSIYHKGAKATQEQIIRNIAKLEMAFPKMERGFFKILLDRIDANSFSNKRLENAVNYVIDKFQYKELNVADIISWDKHINIYTHSQVCNLINKSMIKGFEDTEIREINGTKYWVLKSDLAKL